MRRRLSAKEPPKSAIRRCERCGATASASALQCTICGQSFASSVQVSQLWGAVEPAPTAADPPLLDLYASEGEGRTFRAGGAAPGAALDRVDMASDRRPTLGRTSDPWASGSGTLAVHPGRPEGGAPLSPPPAGERAKRGRRGGETSVEAKAGRSGGSRARAFLSAVLLLLILGGAAVWFGGRPYLTQQVADNVGGAIDDELESVAALPVDDAGRITVVEGDITRSLRANADAYAPVTDPRVALSRNGVRVTFTLYGQAHTLTGTLAVEDGRIVLVDPVLDGPASRLIDVGEIAAASEESIADMFARLSARPVSVKTSDDTLVVTTEAA